MVIPTFEKVSGYHTRIPSSLQAVFLASNRGARVDEAPLDRSANRDYSQRHQHVFAKIKERRRFKESTVNLDKSKFVFATIPSDLKVLTNCYLLSVRSSEHCTKYASLTLLCSMWLILPLEKTLYILLRNKCYYSGLRLMKLPWDQPKVVLLSG